MPVKVTRLSDALGAEISGLDLSKLLEADEIAAIDRAFLDHLVILLRGQDLAQTDQERFCRYFGEIEQVQSDLSINQENPHVLYVANVQEPGKQTVLENGAMWFHSDQCYYDRPSAATSLYAIEVPREGGNTRFADCYAAYEALDDDAKRRLEGREAMNAYDYGDEMQIKRGRRDASARTCAHPVIRTHPRTGRKALYVNRLMTEYIVDMDPNESRDLLEVIYAHMEKPEFVYEHVWRPGDLVMWDNRCTVHARTDFDPNERRVLRRMTIRGEIPF